MGSLDELWDKREQWKSSDPNVIAGWLSDYGAHGSPSAYSDVASKLAKAYEELEKIDSAIDSSELRNISATGIISAASADINDRKNEKIAQLEYLEREEIAKAREEEQDLRDAEAIVAGEEEARIREKQNKVVTRIKAKISSPRIDTKEEIEDIFDEIESADIEDDDEGQLLGKANDKLKEIEQREARLERARLRYTERQLAEKIAEDEAEADRLAEEAAERRAELEAARENERFED